MLAVQAEQASAARATARSRRPRRATAINEFLQNDLRRRGPVAARSPRRLAGRRPEAGARGRSRARFKGQPAVRGRRARDDREDVLRRSASYAEAERLLRSRAEAAHRLPASAADGRRRRHGRPVAESLQPAEQVGRGRERCPAKSSRSAGSSTEIEDGATASVPHGQPRGRAAAARASSPRRRSFPPRGCASAGASTETRARRSRPASRPWRTRPGEGGRQAPGGRDPRAAGHPAREVRQHRAPRRPSP